MDKLGWNRNGLRPISPISLLLLPISPFTSDSACCCIIYYYILITMSNTRVKGLLKGLRYISQIFENEKEAEMQIGHPTDVKHVAHIGWDGPASVNSPSWMNEFKAPPTFSSAPLSLPAPGDIKDDVSVKWLSGDCNRRGGIKASNAAAKPSRRQSSSGTGSAEDSSQSPASTREKIDKPKPRRSSKPKDYSAAPSFGHPEIPRNARRKKTTSAHTSTRSKPHMAEAVAETYKSPFSDPGSATAPMSMSASEDTALCRTP